jgi:hypothetical protein
VRRWPKILPEADARRGIAAGLLVAGLAFGWVAAWAQVDAIESDQVLPSTMGGRTRDGEPVKLPAYPNADDLVGFFVSSASDFKFFIDRRSLSIRSDGVVRYTLVARSPEGVDNVTYEGIHCNSSAYRIYATGHADRSWSKRPTGWRPIEPKSVARWRYALLGDYFCPAGAPILTVADGIDGLKRGRNSFLDESDRP